MKKSLLLLLFSFTTFAKISRADEGMWLPLLLKSMEGDMQAKGLKLSAEDLYSINKSSLKDAVVLFGGGCTGEIVSTKGLLFTNHHCGISMVQSHSSVENDYIKNGFWAKTMAEELPNPGLSVTLIVRIEDVTAQVGEAVKDAKTQSEINTKLDAIEAKAVEGTHYKADIREFDYGNAYYMFVTETFTDIRLAGAPPQAVGEFGGDTDNWMWPRHTGDFSIFRIYAGKDNKPAAYAADNIPYTPKHALNISTDGVNKGDFAMVYGFPGRTQQYLPAVAVDFIVNESNPAKIAMRDKGLAAMNASMKQSDKVRIQYTAKESRISNYWKKWRGESMGLKKTNALQKKLDFEEEFTQRIGAKKELVEKYGTVLPAFKTLYADNKDMLLAMDYFTELYSQSGPELFKYISGFENLVTNYATLEKDKKLDDLVARTKKSVEAFYKNFDLATDRQMMEQVLPVFLSGCPVAYHPGYLTKELAAKKNSVSMLVADVYNTSVFASQEQVLNLLEKPSAFVARLKKDKAYLLAMDMVNMYRQKLEPANRTFQIANDRLMNQYVAAIYEVVPEKKIWYDANSTMRIGYGLVEGSQPRDGMEYTHYTTTEGILEKFQSGADEYIIPQKLQDLLVKKDFGPYADKDGTLHTCFTSSSQTTGGNSGSPVLNAHGELIGLNFDRSWESTMSDIMYSGKLCRNIVTDIRYVLFIMDKYAGATHLVGELNLVNAATRKK